VISLDTLINIKNTTLSIHPSSPKPGRIKGFRAHVRSDVKLTVLFEQTANIDLYPSLRRAGGAGLNFVAVARMYFDNYRFYIYCG
jgi:hypothetical protein